MSAGASEGSGEDQDFELNLAPIIDCFTVLITYMLATASFISIDTLNVSVNSISDQPIEQPLEPQQSLTLQVNFNHELIIDVLGKETSHVVLAPGSDGTPDVNRLKESLAQVKEKWPELKEVSVKAEPGVPYRQIVKVIENTKPLIGKVFLGD